MTAQVLSAATDLGDGRSVVVLRVLAGVAPPRFSVVHANCSPIAEECERGNMG